MKICIELDNEMEARWGSIKSALECAFHYERGLSVTLPDDVMLKGLLHGFENDCCSWSFPYQFTEEELKAMKE
jgi:hypothetical protein